MIFRPRLFFHKSPEGTVICKLQYLIGLIRQGIYSSQEYLSLEKIDEIFRFLERYAPVMESGFEYDGEVLTFDKYTAAIRNDYSKTVAKIKKEADETVQHAKREYESSLYAGLEAERRRYHRKNITAAAVCAVIAALAVIGAFTVSSYFLTQKNRAEREASAAAAEKAAAVRLSYRKGPGNKAV